MNSNKVDTFTSESISKMAKIISDKFGDKAIEILTLLQGNELLNRSTICNKIKYSQPIVDKWLDALECSTAIESTRVATSYIYRTTPVGSEILKNLINYKEEKERGGND